MAKEVWFNRAAAFALALGIATPLVLTCNRSQAADTTAKAPAAKPKPGSRLKPPVEPEAAAEIVTDRSPSSSGKASAGSAPVGAAPKRLSLGDTSTEAASESSTKNETGTTAELSTVPPDPTTEPETLQKPAAAKPAASADEEPLSGAATAQAAGEGKKLVMQAYQLTKTANNEAAYTRVITLCEEAMTAPLAKDTAIYARRLAAWAYNRRGETYSDVQRYQEAMDDFQVAVDFDPQLWRAMHNRGVTLALLGKYDEAIADFNRTVQLNPKYANAYYNRGELLYEVGEYARAILDYSEALALNPKDVSAYNSRGHAYYRLERYREAIGDYSQALKLDPKNAAALTNRGDVFSDLGSYEQAGADYRSALKLDPQLGRAYQSAAWLMATCPVPKFRNPKLAVEAAQKALKIDGDRDHRYLETLAAAQAAIGDYAAAERTQQRVLEVVPKDAYERNEKRLELYQRGSSYTEPARVATRPGAAKK